MSSAFEPTGASFLNRSTAFFVILSPKDPPLLGVLVAGLQPDRIGETAPHSRPGRLDCKRCTLSNLSREFYCFLTQSIGRRQQVGESPCHSLFAGNAPSG